MSEGDNNLLISIDFRIGKGGIARVARLIFDAIKFKQVLSLHGEGKGEFSVHYYNKNRVLLLLKAYWYIFINKPELIVFDHLHVARLLSLVPNSYIHKAAVFLHDEEAWKKVSGFQRVALIKATHIVCNSEYTRKRFLEHNPEFQGKTRVCLPGGVPTAFINYHSSGQTNPNMWLSDPRPYCLFVARLWKEHRYKGYLQLLNAFKAYYSDAPSSQLRLAIIGNGNDAEEVGAFIERAKLGGKVTLFRNIDDSLLAEFYQRTICLFFPSTREGFGMVYLEAMYFKKACIGIKGQPAEEIIMDGETGKLLSDNEPETLKPIIKDIEDNLEKYISYGLKGHQRYLDKFTNEHFKNRFVEIIKR